LRCDLQATGGDNFEPEDAATGVLHKKDIYLILMKKKCEKRSRTAQI
jgi:hypothetical protein